MGRRAKLYQLYQCTSACTPMARAVQTSMHAFSCHCSSIQLSCLLYTRSQMSPVGASVTPAQGGATGMAPGDNTGVKS